MREQQPSGTAVADTDEFAIAIVVDPDFGDRLPALVQRLEVYVVGSPANRGVAKQIYRENDRNVQVLRGSPFTPDQQCASFLRTALEFSSVADHDPPLSIVEVFGTPLTAELRKVFEEQAFPVFHETADGFVARSRRRPGPRAKGVPRPFGLALSGGGLRATAFHLGVLKRLRELHLLEYVDFVSTVSGGSVAGAYWVHCQAKQDTIHDAAEWDKFEASLIGFMMFGARGWVLWHGFWLPFLAILIVALAIHTAWFSWVWPPPDRAIWSLAGVFAISIAIAYASWHYRAARLFERLLDRELFKGATLNDLTAPTEQRSSESDQGRAAPFLILNATGLSSGDHLLFTPLAAVGSPARKLLLRVLPNTGIPMSRKKRRRTQHRDIPPRVCLDVSTPLARAVAASCALPGVFAPLLFPDPEPSWETPSWWPGRFVVVDGGVKDNQGTQVLLDGRCRGLIVSDAAAALRTVPRPWTWQMFPPGKGVVFRSQDIIYERMRDLGYQLIEERYEFSRRLEEAGLRDAAEAADAALLDGYAYVELHPSDEFRWQDGSRLPPSLFPFVASIRTDLDRFSAVEVSALMFHGYTIIDHCIRGYQPLWVQQAWPPLQFASPVSEIFDWWAISSSDRVRHISHLSMSDGRLAWYRSLKRKRILKKNLKIWSSLPASERDA